MSEQVLVQRPALTMRESILNWFRQANQNGRLTALILFLPLSIFLFTLFVILPLGEAAFYSLFKWNGFGELNTYVGTGNYQRLFDHNVFGVSIWNTIKIILVSLAIQLPLGLVLALCIYEKSWANNVFRLIFFLPYILAEVVAGLIWSFVYDGDYGILAHFTTMLNMDSLYLLANKEWAFNAVLVVIVWKYFGFHMMIYIAGLQGVPKDLIEAAKIDGASRWQVIRFVKVPLIIPAIILSVFFSVLGALQTFDLIVPLTGGGPSNSSHTIVSYLYQFGITRMKIGFGSAVGVTLFIFCVIFAFTYKRTMMQR